MRQEGKHPIGKRTEQANDGKYQQHIAGEEQEEEDTKYVHTQGQHQMDEEITDTQISGEQKDEEDTNIAD
eukprot:13425100-Heterocapsa_arctica.AAC.1